MPSLTVVQALTSGQRGYNPLANWKFRYAPYRALVRVGINTTGASNTVICQGTIGTTEVMAKGPVSAGGTAGVMPAPLNVPYSEFIAEAGDLIELSIDETAAATPTVNVFVAIDPV
jgi:hypothetical protein